MKIPEGVLKYSHVGSSGDKNMKRCIHPSYFRLLVNVLVKVYIIQTCNYRLDKYDVIGWIIFINKKLSIKIFVVQSFD